MEPQTPAPLRSLLWPNLPIRRPPRWLYCSVLTDRLLEALRLIRRHFLRCSEYQATNCLDEIITSENFQELVRHCFLMLADIRDDMQELLENEVRFHAETAPSKSVICG